LTSKQARKWQRSNTSSWCTGEGYVG
jgi:hypothetical protein